MLVLTSLPSEFQIYWLWKLAIFVFYSRSVVLFETELKSVSYIFKGLF